MNLTEKVAAASVAALIASSAAYVSQMDSPAEPPAEKVVETDSYTDPCPYTSEVEHLTCELNENGYNVSEDDVVKLVRTIYFEGHWDGGQHEYDTVAWSMRNQLDLGQYIRDEGLDTSYIKGDTLPELLVKGQYDAISMPQNQRYFNAPTDQFKAGDMTQSRVDKAVWAVYRAFTTDASERLHTAPVYNNADLTSQDWQNQEFLWLDMANSDTGDDKKCLLRSIGHVPGVEYTNTGEHSVESSHTFYTPVCDMDGDGTYTPLLQ